MMSTVDRMEYFEDSSWQGVQLRYQGLDFGFVLLLPKKRLAPGELIGALSSDLVDRSLRDAAFAKVELSLPRFKTRSSMDLLDTLTAYGLGHLRDGDYSGVSTADVVRLGGVIHEAVVSVDEEGTEAAAATAIAMVGSGAPLREDKPKKVRADHPFAFAIVHRSSGAPLFVGVVGDPR
jgi:serpin B